MFYKEHAAASEKDIKRKYATASERHHKKNMYSCFSELCPLNKCFKVKKLKIKTMFMYFWLNYSDEYHHVERIPIAVKNIDHFFIWPVK